MSFGEYFNAFGSIGDAYREAFDRADQKRYAQDAADLSSKQLDAYLAQQGAQPQIGLGMLGQSGAPQMAPGPMSALGATATPRLPTFADASGSDGSYLSNLFKRESGNNPNARPETSGAAGLGQFIPSTWNGIVRAHPDLGLTPISPGAPDPRKDERQMIAATKALTADNEAVLSRAGLPVNDATRYSLHFLGANGGPKFVAGALSNPNAPAVAFVQPGQAAANRNVFFNRDGSPKTAGQVMGSFQRSFGGGGNTRVAQAPVAVPTFGGGQVADAGSQPPAMQMPGVIANPPMPPQRPVQLASADPDSMTLPANAAAGYQSPYGPSGGPDPVPAPLPQMPPQAPRQVLQAPQMAPPGGPRAMTMPGQPAPQALPAPAPVPQQAAAGGGDDEANVPAPNAQPAGFQIPPGGASQSLPQQSVTAPDFVPGTVAAPAIQNGRGQDLPAVQGAPRMTPQQAQFLRAQLANPLTRAQAIQAIQGLNAPDKWETKELGGRVVQVNGRGDVRALPGFDKPVTLQTQKGADGNDYTFNPQTGQWTRAIAGESKQFSDVTDAAQRQAAGVPDWYQGTVQRGPDGRIYYPGAGQQGVTPAQKTLNKQEEMLAEDETKNVLEARNGATHAATKLQTLATLTDAWKRSNGSIYTGPGAETVLKAKQAAKNFGIDLGGVPESEIVSKVGTQLAAQTAKDLTSRPTQFDFAVMLQNNPGLMVSEAGNRTLINIGQQQAKHELQLAALARKWRPGQDWGAMREEFEQKNPIVSPLTGKPLNPNELIDPSFAPPPSPGSGQGAPGGQQAPQLRPMAPDLMSEARAAIAAGKPAGAVIQRLRERGFDPAGL